MLLKPAILALLLVSLTSCAMKTHRVITQDAARFGRASGSGDAERIQQGTPSGMVRRLGNIGVAQTVDQLECIDLNGAGPSATRGPSLRARPRRGPSEFAVL